MALVRSSFSEREIDEALAVYADSRSLDDAIAVLDRTWGRAPARSTLSKWTRTYPDHWANAKRTAAEMRDGRIRDSRHKLMEKATGLVDLGLDILHKAMLDGQIEPQRISGVVKDAMIVYGIGDDKESRDRGMPGSIVEVRKTGEEVLRSLRARGLAIDSTAVDVGDDEDG